MCPPIPGGSVQCAVEGLPNLTPHDVWCGQFIMCLSQMMGQSQPTGGRTGSVKATANSGPWRSVEGRVVS